MANSTPAAARICEARDCDNPVVGRRSDAKYCSTGCGYREKRKRWRAVNPGRTRELGRKHARLFRERHPERKRAWDDRYREATRDRRRMQQRRYREAHRDVVLTRKREDWRRNRARYLAKARKRYMANRPVELAKRRAWYWADPDARREQGRLRYLRNPEAAKVRARAYQARRKGAVVVVAFDRAAILAESGGLCVYCGEAATHLDHVLALVRGGHHHPANLVGACAFCNISKGDRLLTEWFRQDRVGYAAAVSPKVAAEVARLQVVGDVA